MKELIFKYQDKEIKHGDKTQICAILNVTPDSFSDGGKWNEKDKALKHAKDLLAQGATIIDVGGESTRPGSTYVEIQEEIERVVPVIETLKKETDAIISVDTWKAEVARETIIAGADIINDITGLLGDKDMARVIAASKCGAIVMFNPVIARPNHKSSKIFPKFGKNDIFTKEEYSQMEDEDIIAIMKKYFAKSLEIAKANNLAEERIMLDPGIGFGLTKRENLLLIDKIEMLYDLGFTVFLGVSRKRFIANILEESGIDADTNTKIGLANADMASSILSAIASYKSVEIVRVHSVKEHKIAIEITDSLRNSSEIEDMDFGSYKN